MPLYSEAEKLNVVENVRMAAERIIASPEFLPHIASVGTRVVMALPNASSLEHVAGVEDRISRSTKAIRAVKFGVSSHLAWVVLTAMKFDPTVRAALNICYMLELVDAFRGLGYTASRFSREEAPMDVKAVEGGILIWGTEQVIRRIGKVPDAIFDIEESRKEPMMRVLGVSATEAVKKALVAIRDVEFNKQIHL